MLAQAQSSPQQRATRSLDTVLLLEPAGKGSDVGKHLLPAGQLLLGSSPDCGLTLVTQGVRPRHCLILTDRRRSLVRALDTDTWLNEARVREAVLQPGDRLTLGSAHLRVREATMRERLSLFGMSASRSTPPSSETPQPMEPSPAAASSFSRRKAGTRFEEQTEPQRRAAADQPGVTENHGVDRLRDELQRQLGTLKRDIAAQQEKLADLLDRAGAAASQFAVQQRAAGEADERILAARRKESVVRELLLALQQRAEELNARERALTLAYVRRQDELSRRFNDAAIDAALVRSTRRRVNERQRELEDRLVDFKRQQIEWTESKRNSEQELARRRQQAADLQTRLERQLIHVKVRDEELQREEAERRQRNSDVERQSEQLRAAEQAREEELENRKLALSARLTGMARLEATLAQRQRELERLRDDLQAGQQELRVHTSEINRLRDRITATAEEQLALETELGTRERDLDRRQEQLQEREDEFDQRAARLEADRSDLHKRAAEQDELVHRQEAELSRLDSRAREFATWEESLASRESELSQKKQDVDALRAELNERARRLDEQQRELDSLRESEQARADAVRAELDEFRQSQNEQFHAREQTLSRREQELSRLRGDLQAERIQLDSRSDQLAAEKKRLAEERQQLERGRQSLGDAERQLEQELADVRDEEEQLRLLRLQLAGERDACDQQRRELESKNEELETDRSEIRSAREELSRERESLDDERQKLAATRSELDAERQSLAAARSALEAEHDAVDSEKRKAAQQREALDTEAERLEDERQRLQRQLQQLEGRQAECNQRQKRLEEERAALLEQIRHGWDELADRRDRLTDGETELAFRDARLDDLRDQLAGERRELKAKREALRAEEERLGTERGKLEHGLEKVHAAAQGEGKASVDSGGDSGEGRADLQSAIDDPADDDSQLAGQPYDLVLETDAVGESRSDSEKRLEFEHQGAPADGEDLLSLFDRCAAEMSGEEHSEPHVVPDDLENDAEPPDSAREPHTGENAPAAGHENVDDVGPDAETSDLRATLADMFGIDPAQIEGKQASPPGDGSAEDDTTESRLADQELPVPALAEPQQPDVIEDASLTSLLESIGNDDTEQTTVRAASEASGDAAPADPADEPAESAERPADSMPNSDASLPGQPDFVGADDANSADSDASADEEGAECDTISAYMEQLLARSRKNAQAAGQSPRGGTSPGSGLGGTHPKAAHSSKSEPTTEKLQSPPAQQPTGAPYESSSPSGDAVEPKPSSIDGEFPAEPAHRQDKQAVRADINSLRELANLSARTAIATHVSRKIRGKVLVKSLLTVVSFTVAGVLLTGEFWGNESYDTTGWAAAIVGVIMAAELARSTLLMHRMTSLGDSSGSAEERRDDSSAGDDDALPNTDRTGLSQSGSEDESEPIEIDAYIIDEDDEPATDVVEDTTNVAER